MHLRTYFADCLSYVLHIAHLILPYIPGIIDLLKRTCQDEDRSDAVYIKAMGLIGDLAEAFPNGEIRDQLLAEWVVNNLVKSKPRGLTQEGKRTIKWAKEVREITFCPSELMATYVLDGPESYCGCSRLFSLDRNIYEFPFFLSSFLIPSWSDDRHGNMKVAL